MTGLDVLERCAAYARERERMQSAIYMARDALTRCTRSTDAQGHGGGDGDRMGAAYARIDAMERRMRALDAAHALEVLEAARLCGAMDDPVAARMLYGTMVEGMTMRQMQGELGIASDAAAKAIKRRGRLALTATATALGGREDYARLRRAALGVTGDNPP